MRLLLVYDCAYPETLGGVEHRNHQLALALAARGHTVDVTGWTAGEREIAPGARVLPLPWPTAMPQRVGRRRAVHAAQLARAVRHLPLAGYDVVETANIPFSHLLPLAWRCARARLPLVVTWHEVWGGYWRDFLGWPLWPLAAATEVLLAQLGDVAVAVSPLTAERLRRLRLRSRPLVVPNGVPVGIVRAAAAGQPPGPPLVFAGRLLADKQVDVLLHAVARLRAEPGAGAAAAAVAAGPLLAVVGDGPERPALERLTGELGLGDAVAFRGQLATPEDVWAQLGAARVAVQPSRREGFGLFPLEAMAAGLPVVYCSAPRSAVETVVRDGVEGIRVAAEPGPLAAALRSLLDDEAERRRLGENALRRAEQHDWGEVAARLEEVFAAAALTRRSAPRGTPPRC